MISNEIDANENEKKTERTNIFAHIFFYIRIVTKSLKYLLHTFYIIQFERAELFIVHFLTFNDLVTYALLCLHGWQQPHRHRQTHDLTFIQTKEFFFCVCCLDFVHCIL